MFESLKNIDTIKSQMLTGIIAGVIILFLLFIPGIIVHLGIGPYMYQANMVTMYMWSIARWILLGCSLALMILGGLNIYKGMIGYGLTGIFFGLLFLMGFAYTVDMVWRNMGLDHYDVCITTLSPFHKK